MFLGLHLSLVMQRGALAPAAPITFDDNTVTFDSNTVTFDGADGT